MSQTVVIWLVVLGLGVVVVRRRPVALALVACQSALLAVVATRHAFSAPDLIPAAGALWVRVVVITVVLGIGIARTPERRPLPAGIEPLTRAVIAIAVLMTVGVLVPPLGIASAAVERGALSLLALGIVITMTRRATIIQILGIVVSENAATTLALSSAAAVPTVIELGVVFDLLLIAIVTTAFHERIFGEFGSGDAGVLRGLRD